MSSSARQIQLTSSGSQPPPGASGPPHPLYRGPPTTQSIRAPYLPPSDTSPSKLRPSGPPLGRSGSPTMVAMSAASMASRGSSYSGFRGGASSDSLRYVQYPTGAFNPRDAVFIRQQPDRVAVPVSVPNVPASVPDIRPVHPGVTSAAQSSSQQPRPMTLSNNPYRASIYPSNDGYLRDVASGHPGNSLNLHPGVHLPIHTPTPAAASDVTPMPKRPRMELGHSQITTPLRIDTREAAKDSGYHPQVEAISPTGPDAPVERDELRSTKDDLLQKITKVDREIAKAESQIAKLKKKQQELEDASSKPLSDSNDDDEKPKNQSLAQTIYAENRKKARRAHAVLDKLSPITVDRPHNELPLYNQPSDTDTYRANKESHAMFKRHLIEYFKRRNEDRENRERYMTETYSKLKSTWMKKAEKIENSKKRKEKDAKARELYEKVFPELRKQREDKERDHRLGSRGAVKSEADFEDVMERLAEQELEDKKMHSYAVIPPMLLPTDERRRKFTNKNGLIYDPMNLYSERKFLNVWTDEEKEIFKEKYLQYPKNFGQIAQSLERKSVSECVQYYYLSKKTENYKQLLRKARVRGKKTRAPATASQAEVIGGNNVTGVITRQKNRNELKTENPDDQGGSNRSTPQPVGVKQEPKNNEDKENEEGEKRGNGKKGENHDSSDEEDAPQQVKSCPHPCALCKTTVESSRPVQTKSYIAQLGLKEEDVTPETRVCNNCHCKAMRKKQQNAACPIPTCTSTKGRVKGRLRHMPGKWSELAKEIKEAIIAELQIPDGVKKCCSTCFTRITRKMNNSMGGDANDTAKVEADNIVWTEDEVEILKGSLREHGRNWNAMAERIAEKTREQCKKFFYDHRKKHQLDKIVLEFKRSNQSGDGPPMMSSDEESGSSTSSCDEAMPVCTSETPSRANSPANKNAAATNGNATDIKPPAGIKVETSPYPPIKTEVKVEEPPVQPKTATKEEDCDSSATLSADETITDPNSQRGPYPSMPYPHPVMPRADIKPHFPPNMVPGRAAPTFPMPRPPYPPGSVLPRNPMTANGPRETITVKELMINVIERSLSTTNASNPCSSQQQAPPQTQLPPSVSPTIHTLLEHSGPAPLMKNYVRDKVGLNPLHKPPIPEGRAMAPPAPPPASGGPPPQQSSNDCETLDLSMPSKRREVSPPPASHTAGASNQYREPQVHTLPPHARGSPSLTPDYSSSRNPPPPAHSNKKTTTVPDIYRDIPRGGDPHRERSAPSPFGSDGRPTPPPHMINRGVDQALPPPRSAGRPPSQSHYARHPPGAQPLGSKNPSPISPKIPGKPDKPLTIQTGSITQGTPVSHRTGYESLLRITPPESKPIGSITHGTPVYDKKHQQIIVSEASRASAASLPPGYERSSAEFYKRGNPSPGNYPYPSSAAVASASQQQRPASYGNDPHLSSRQVIMNDFAMARSTEMQRRPDSRDLGRPMSPQQRAGASRDLSPRPGSLEMRMADPRAALDIRAKADLRPDLRIELKGIPDGRGDPKADIRALDTRGDPRADLRGDPRAGLDRRGDPRAGLDHRSDPRMGLDPRILTSDPRARGSIDPRAMIAVADPRSDPRVITDPRVMDPRLQIDPRAANPPRTTYSNYPMYITNDGRPIPVSSHDRQRSSPPQSRAALVQQRPGLTSGKPIVTKPGLSHREVEIYRTHPEVTISKTNSPRLAYNEQNPLASLVDVAVQQPKLPDPKLDKDRMNPTLAMVTAAAQANQSRHSQLANYERHKYELERQRQYEAAQQQASRNPPPPDRDRFGNPTGIPVSREHLQPSTSSLVRQVELERAKQMYLMQEREKAVLDREYSARHAMVQAAAEQQAKSAAAAAQNNDRGIPQSGPAAARQAAAVAAAAAASGDEGRQLTAAVLIDAIITHSINQGPPADGGINMPLSKFRRSPGEAPGNTQTPIDVEGKASPYKVPSRSPSVKSGGDHNNVDEGGPASRPGSRSSTVGYDYRAGPPPGAGGDHPDNKDNNESMPDQYWKRRYHPQNAEQSRGLPPPRTSTSLIPGGHSGSDERQITRVAQTASPRPEKPPSRPGVEPISPPSTERISPATSAPSNDMNAINRFIEARRRPPMPTHDGGKAGPGMSPLVDYVKSRIVEEMKKEAPPFTMSVTAPSADTPVTSSGGMKRPHDMQNNTESDDGPRGKKPHLEQRNNGPVDTSNDLPDSPGSGEMVIDESVRPDSVSSQKTSSPAPDQFNKSRSSPATSAAPPTSAASSRPASNAPPAAPRYEPLSDDD